MRPTRNYRILYKIMSQIFLKTLSLEVAGIIVCIGGKKFGWSFDDQGNCSKQPIRYHKNIKMPRRNYQIFYKLSKTSWTSSPELQKVENWTTVACTELIEAAWQKKPKHIEMKKITVLFHIKTKHNT